MNKKTFAIIAFSVLAIFACSVAAVDAQVQEFKPLTDLPGVFEKGQATDPVKVLSGVYGLAIGLGAVIAVIMIIVAGFEYMYQESISGKSAAKERITNAFLGLGVILASFIILRTINADLVDFNLRLPGGSGRLSGLAAEQKNIEGLQNSLRAAAQRSFERNREIAQLQSSAQAKDAEIKSLLARKAQIDAKTSNTQADQAELESIESRLETLNAEKAQLASVINDKKIENVTELAKVASTVQREYSLDNAIKHFKEGLDDSWTSVGENQAAVDIYTRIINDTNRQTDVVEARIRELSSLSLQGEAASKRDAAIESLRQDAEYLRHSKAVISPPIPIGVIQDSDLARASSAMESKLEQAELWASDFERRGRSDLAAQLRDDAAKALTIAKIRHADRCKETYQSIRASASLCKE